MGKSAAPIRAEFSSPLQPAGGVVRISVEFQALAGSTLRVAYALLDEAGGKRVFVIDAFTYEPTGAQDP